MNTANLYGPMLAMIMLTFVVWVYMYARRIPFINQLDLQPDQLTGAKLAELSPPAVSNPSDNLKNLFEMPALFYVLCLLLSVTGAVDTIHTVSAWIFVAFRALHSAMHCTANIVIVRFGLYLVSSIAFWFMFFRTGLGMLST